MCLSGAIWIAGQGWELVLGHMANYRSDSNDAADAAKPPATLAKAVSLHIEGKLKDALVEINRVIESGDVTAEPYSAKAHILYQLEQYEDAAKTYAKLLTLDP